MRYNSLGSIALDANATPKAVCGWLNDITTGPFKRETSPAVFELVIRPVLGGVVSNTSPLLNGVTGGADALASGGNRWMRRLDGATPKLNGSQAWTPSDGHVGDISFNGTAIVLDADTTTAFVYIDGRYSHSFARGGASTRPSGALRLSASGRYATWVQFPGPKVVCYDVFLSQPVNVATVTTADAHYTPVVLDHLSGLWVAYHTAEHGGVLHRVENSIYGYLWGTAGSIYDPDIIVSGDGCRLGWSTNSTQSTQEEIMIPVLGGNMVVLSGGTTAAGGTVR